MNLRSTLAPLSVPAFLTTFYGQLPAHIPGPPDKFRSLLSWSDLSHVLSQHRFTGPRLRLVKRGENLRPDQYLLTPDDPCGSLVADDRLMDWLRKGATLVLNKVDELLAPVRVLSESCEQAFRTDVGVNLYAAWGSEHGFKLHWDDHDTMIVQLAGSKRWQIYEPTRTFPKHEDPVTPPAPAEGARAWDLLLTEGSVLYIPRGWWHIAVPQDGLSVHLTFGPRPPTGADFVRWLAERLYQREEYRRDVPVWTRPESLQGHLAELIRGLMAFSDGLSHEYLDALDKKAHRRPSVQIGPVLDPDVTPLTPQSQLVLRTQRGPRVVQIENGRAELSFDGVRWHLPRELALRLSAQDPWKGILISDLLASLPTSEHDNALEALDTLRSTGAATIVHAP